MFLLFNFSSNFPGGGQLTPFVPMCGRPNYRRLHVNENSGAAVLKRPEVGYVIHMLHCNAVWSELCVCMQYNRPTVRDDCQRTVEISNFRVRRIC